LLWLRTGEAKRRHFAHRTLKECPLATKSREVLEAQAYLYRWLESQYPGRVEIDVNPEESAGELLADIRFVSDSQKVVLFWIFDRQQKHRDRFLRYRGAPGFHPHFIHTASTLKFHTEDEITLSASQRDFIVCSDFDRSLTWGSRGHLHFLNSENGLITVFRELHQVHSPNLFGWELKHEFQLALAALDEETGEIVCQEDLSAILGWRQKIAEEERKIQKRCFADKHHRLHEQHETVQKTPAEDHSLLCLTGAFRCEDCGEMTSDWSSCSPATKTCVCRQCSTKRHQKAQSKRNPIHL
jgi:hypothetical protein